MPLFMLHKSGLYKHIKNPYQNLVMPLDAAQVRVKHKEQYCHFWCCTSQRLDASRSEDPFVNLVQSPRSWHVNVRTIVPVCAKLSFLSLFDNF